MAVGLEANRGASASQTKGDSLSLTLTSLDVGGERRAVDQVSAGESRIVLRVADLRNLVVNNFYAIVEGNSSHWQGPRQGHRQYRRNCSQKRAGICRWRRPANVVIQTPHGDSALTALQRRRRRGNVVAAWPSRSPGSRTTVSSGSSRHPSGSHHTSSDPSSCHKHVSAYCSRWQM